MESAEISLRKYLDMLLDEMKYKPREIEVKAISSGGANYTSGLFKVSVTCAGRDSLHLFAKVAIVEGELREQLTIADMFLHEQLVYEELRKAYDNLQTKYRIPEKDRFRFSKYYGSSLEPRCELVIFEDLNAKGFQIYDRFETLNWDHVFENIKALANFHALSFNLEKENPELFEKFKTFKFPVDALMEILRSDPENYFEGLSENHKTKLRKFLKNVGGLEAMIDFYKPFGRGIIIHSDFRPSNIMHKQEGENIIVMPLDYQNVRVGSAASDLLFFLVTATDGAFRKQHYERLLASYYEQLASRLTDMGVRVDDVYPRWQFDKEIEKMLPLALLFGISLLPAVLVPANAVPLVAGDDVSSANFILRPTPQSTARLTDLVEDCIRWKIL